MVTINTDDNFKNQNNTDFLTETKELYSLLKEGLDDVKDGNTRPFSNAMQDIKNTRSR